MQTFTDRKGQSWEVEITLPDVARLRDAGFDLNAINTDEQAIAAISDTDTFSRVVVIVCGDAMRSRGLSIEEFTGLFNGPTIHAAMRAFLGAVADFTQPPTVAAEINRGLTAAWDQTERAAVAKVRTILSGLSDSGGASPGTVAPAPLG